MRWHIKVDRKKAAGAPMRIGVQRTGVRLGSNWNDKTVKTKHTLSFTKSHRTRTKAQYESKVLAQRGRVDDPGRPGID